MHGIINATRVASLLAIPLLLSCAGTAPANLGVTASRLAPCPSSPNCVSSDSEVASHQVEPLALSAPPATAWRAAVEVVSHLSRTRIVTETPGYLHAECRSALFRFVDDLELHLRASDGVIAVRSASRAGYSDLGVNRRRIERVRSTLIDRGVVRAE
jgi:uncharacterized protein (DUF1499 family)